MNSLAECSSLQLPFLRKEKLENPKNWVRLWEGLAARGPAILLESAGPVHEASRWILLAGESRGEYFEQNGKPHWRNQGAVQASNIDVFKFLDEFVFKDPSIGRETPSAVKGGCFAPSGASSRFSPFPHCLSDAWFGIFSYEFGRDLNLRFPRPNDLIDGQIPDYYFFKPGSILAFDRLSKEVYYFGDEMRGEEKKEVVVQEPFEVSNLSARINLAKYKEMVEKVKGYIEQGDIYQANIAQSFQARWRGNSGSLYGRLKEINPGPFMGLFQGKGFTLVSSSPERLVSGQGDWLETRPIAGTRPRGQDEVRDLQLQWELKTNPKEQAEHLMLVDLARNDMGKIAGFGTVDVKSFAEVETYAKVQHLVSVVQARRAAPIGFTEILKSLFPGGTITGCPKIRCMEIIEETEGKPRGFYTGSMGYGAPGPCFDFNILIRSLTLYPDGTLDFSAGAGIVADSDPEKEYKETLFKVEALAQALGSSFIKGEG